MLHTQLAHTKRFTWMMILSLALLALGLSNGSARADAAVAVSAGVHAEPEIIFETKTPLQSPTATRTLAPTATPTPMTTPTNAPGRLAGLHIGLDPGHQREGNSAKEPIAPGSSEKKKKVSWGATGTRTGIEEYKTNLEISLKLRKRLIQEGARVIMTREVHDVDISNRERALMMNRAGVDIWFRVHCNGSDNQKKHGIGCYVRETGPMKRECYFAGECMLQGLSEATGARANGVYKSDTYTGNNWSEVTCVLVEMGYITNPNEDVLLNTPSYQDKVVEGYIDGLEVWWSDYSQRMSAGE